MREVVMLRRLWYEEEGVLTFEWILLVTLLVIGVVGGMVAARDALTYESAGVAGAIVANQQGYVVANPVRVGTNGGTSSVLDNGCSGALDGFGWDMGTPGNGSPGSSLYNNWLYNWPLNMAGWTGTEAAQMAAYYALPASSLNPTDVTQQSLIVDYMFAMGVDPSSPAYTDPGGGTFGDGSPAKRWPDATPGSGFLSNGAEVNVSRAANSTPSGLSPGCN
jgi:hypothetical protein